MPLPPTIRKTLRVFGWILGSITALLLLITLGSFIANNFDEALTPEAKAMLSPPPNPYPTDDNLFVAFAGFDAPSRSSVMAVGAAKIDRYNERLPTLLTNPTKASEVLPGHDPDELAFKGDLKCCPALASSIWHAARMQPEHFEELIRDNEELVQRYRERLKLSGYYDTAQPSYYEPFYSVPQPEHSLLLADIALRIRSASRSERLAAIDDLAQDEIMWKKVFQGNGTLISMLIGASQLHADFLFLTDMIADPSFDPTLIDDAHQWMVTPFAVSEWRIGTALSTEIRAQHAFLANLMSMSAAEHLEGQSFSWWQKLDNRLQVRYFKVNATDNLEAKRLTALAQWADADPSTFSLRQKAYQRWEKDNVAFPTITALYNPMGKILVAIGSGVYDDYPARIYDIAAVQRLGCLVYQIRRQRIDSAAIPGFLKQHPEFSTHPIDAKPFEWNAATRELKIPVTGKHAEGQRFAVTLFQ